MRIKLNNIFLVGIIAILAYSPLLSQLRIPGEPPSFSNSLSSNIPTIEMPGIDMDEVRMEDASNDDDPLNPTVRVAIPQVVSLGIDNAGEWENLPDGGRIWRLKIRSEGAKFISLLYDQYKLPEGAEFYIYNDPNDQVLGAFTFRNNKADEKFATAVTFGEEVTLEYYEPQAVQGQGELNVSQVGHGYRYFERNDRINFSGDCQVDVNCSPEGDNWQDEKKGVAKILINGAGLCTGSLITNVNQDCRPLFLTADHCLGTVDAIANPIASGWVFYWNFEKPSCDVNDMVTMVDDSQTTSGATLLANAGQEIMSAPAEDATDFALFLLDENPASRFDVYFNGFDASGATGIGGVGIHHPRGDAKMIATHSTMPPSVVNDNYWRIYWDMTPNGWSVTEGGSSGSPLFNNSSNIIGQLFGGFDGGQPNCTDPANDEGDYGKLSVSWDFGATPTRRLRDHLDPNNTGDMVVEGMYGGPTEIICPEDIKYNLDADCNSPIAAFPDIRGLGVVISGECIDTVTQVPVPGTDIMGIPGDTIQIHVEYLDDNGFILDSCNVDLILEDNQSPNVICPPDQELSADQVGCMGLVPDYTMQAVISDNCDDDPDCDLIITQIPAAGQLVPLGDTVIKIIVEDCSMNLDSCMFTVTVTDQSPPVITMEAMSDTVNCDGMGNMAELQAWLDMNGGAVAVDECTSGVGDDTLSWDSELLYSIDMCENTFTREYEFTVSDTSGNSASTRAFFVVIDTMPPIIMGGMDTMLLCNQNGAGNDNALGVWLASNAGATATDECSDVTWTNNFGDMVLDGMCGELQTYPVTFYATDECGNVDSVTFSFELIDTIPPTFLNCPREDVVENIEAGLCDALVNFAPVIALDNCSDVEVNNISSINPVTGEPYKSGDRFPIGITTVYFEAVDSCGNGDTCSIKIIVNDIDTNPDIDCAGDIVDVNDLWECGGTVNIPEPEVNDQCPDLLITTYQIIHEGDTLASGLTNPPADFLFPTGVSTVEYCVQDHPLLLITEVSQDIDTCGGMSNPPMGAVMSDDYIELTNFGPIVYNVSCLLVTREFSGQIDSFSVPDSTFLQPGEVLVLQYGEFAADDDNPDDLLFYKGDAPNLSANDPAIYTIGYDLNTIDQITMFTDAEAGIIRTRVKDNNVSGDFRLADECDTLTIGMYNPDYPPAFDNQANTEMYDTVAIQSIPMHRDECSLTVTITDNENPFCAMRVDTFDYNNGPLSAVVDSCNELIITVPATDSCIVEYIGVVATNMTPLGNVVLTISSPEGTDTTLTGWTGDSLEIQAFYGDKSPGDWRFHFEVLDKTIFSGFSVDDISLSITCLDTWMMNDTMFLSTEPAMGDLVGTCDTVFTWTHPLFLDNCQEGMIEVRYESEDIEDENLPMGEKLDGFGGQEETEFFYVGTTTVKYILMDTAGNVDSCQFDVIVKDMEPPVITFCPPDDTIQLAGGECRRVYEYFPEAEDNCGIESIIGSIPSGSEFEIGENKVTVYVTDINGNVDSSCMFIVTVLEFLPEDIDMSCAEQTNLSLGYDCMATFTADMILEGDNYRCFENYCVRITDENDVVVCEGLLSEIECIFTEEDQNKLFNVTILDCLGTDDILDNEPVNSCWGTILIQEKLIPDISCPRDTIISCNDNISPDSLGFPTIGSCENDIDMYFWDDVETFEECNNPAAIITRTWYVEDGEGNRASCEQTITILPGLMEDIEWPADMDFNDPFLCPKSGEDVPPSLTGIPTIDGKPVNDNHYCNFFVNYSDEVFYGGCEGDFDIIRTWKVKNSCLPLGDDNPVVHFQTISIRDNRPPIINGCPQPMTVSVEPWTCEANLELPLPESVVDICNDITVHAQVFGGGRVIQSGSLEDNDLSLRVEGLLEGDYLVRYTFADVCGNSSVCEYELSVVDDVAPQAIAKEFVVTSITNQTEDGSQVAKVPVESIDNGSWDGCGPVHMLVRRMDGDPNDCDDKDYFPYEWEDIRLPNGNRMYANRFEAIPDAYECVEEWTVAQDNRARLLNPFGFFCSDPGLDTEGEFYSNLAGEIQYNGDEWGEYVKFCCEDVNNNATGQDIDGDGFNNEHQVELIVFDENGNWNLTWAWVKVEDPNPPVIEVNNVEVFCHDDYENLDFEVLGEAVAFDACNEIPYDVEGPFWMTGTSADPSPSVFHNFDGNGFEDFNYTCGFGYGWLRYSAKNSKGIQAEKYQLISVIYKDDFSCDNVYWPLDSTVVGCSAPPPDTLMWEAGACELIGYTLESDTFQINNDGCLKIENKWRLINWCVYEQYQLRNRQDQFYDLWDHADEAVEETYCFDTTRMEPHIPGVYEYTQVIKVIDDTVPELQNCQDTTITNISSECIARFDLINPVIDEGCVNESFHYLVELLDKDAVVARVEGSSTTGNFSFSYDLDGQPSKTLTARWKAWDGCGNTDICEHLVTIVDEKPPTPYMLDLSTALMIDPDPNDGVQEAMIELWACDFDLGSFDNCTADSRLEFTFDGVAPGKGLSVFRYGNNGANGLIPYLEMEQYYSSNGLVMYDIQPWIDFNPSSSAKDWRDVTGAVVPMERIEAVTSAYISGQNFEGAELYRWQPSWLSECRQYTAGKIFTCDDLGDRDVRIDVWDVAGNNDYATSTLTLRSDDCDDATPRAMVMGEIYTPDNIKVPGVEVLLQPVNNATTPSITETSEEGQYAFANNLMYLDYYLAGRKQGDDNAGISTLDLLMIQRHILGLDPFEDPYKMIASDVNYDRRITGSDIIQLRKVILGIYKELPNSESWRFVSSDADYSVEDVLDFYIERRDVPYLSANMTAENLIAVKIGDVNYDRTIRARENITTRSLPSSTLYYHDRVVKKGDFITIPVFGKGDSKIHGLQFTLHLDGARLQSIDGGAIESDNSNYAVYDHHTTVSISTQIGVAANQDLFNISMEVIKDGRISDLLNVNGHLTSNEVYLGEDLNSYQLLIEAVDQEANYNLEQNTPNPFSDFTSIGFDIPADDQVVIQIHDVTGRLIHTHNEYYSAGNHQLRIDKELITGKGVFYYTFSSGSFTEIKKMIVL